MNRMTFTRSTAAIAALLIGPGIPAVAGGAGYEYSGDHGPAHWATLNAEWAACAGTSAAARQSPIDLDDAQPDPSLRPLQLDTRPVAIHLVNNGHTIEQHYEGTGSRIDFEGRQYELLQFHFHTLSEHAVEGRHFAMEMHAVFADAKTSDKLVVGTLFKVAKEANPFLQALIDAELPKETGKSTESKKPINLADGLTDTASYTTYPGSLTTPPCSENVTWVVLNKRARMTAVQHDAFREILGNDFRPLQEHKGRKLRSTAER